MSEFIITNHALERYQERFKGDRSDMINCLGISKKMKASLRVKYYLGHAKQSRIIDSTIFVIDGNVVITCLFASRHQKCCRC